MTDDRRNDDQRCDDIFVAGTGFERARDRWSARAFGRSECNERADTDERVDLGLESHESSVPTGTAAEKPTSPVAHR